MTSVAPVAEPAGPARTSGLAAILEHVSYVLGENRVTAFAFGLLVVILFAAIFGPYIVPYDPLASDTAAALKPPSAAHWFGTDQLGRDIFSRVVVATRLDTFIAVASVVLVFLMGGLAGIAAGYFGGWTDRIVGRVADTIMAFPLFVLAMGIVAALGNTVQNIIIATAIVNFPLYARVARAEANVRRDAGFVQAARRLGVARVVNLDLLTYAGHLENLAALKNDRDHIFVHGDIGDETVVNRLLTEYQPSAIVNFAAESHVDRSILGPQAFIQTNVVGTHTLLADALKYWKNLSGATHDEFRFLHVSTDEVYGSLGSVIEAITLVHRRPLERHGNIAATPGRIGAARTQKVAKLFRRDPGGAIRGLDPQLIEPEPMDRWRFRLRDRVPDHFDIGLS